MTTLWATIIILGVLITIHEYGHFIAARSVGVRVERFSIGIPPRFLTIRSIDNALLFNFTTNNVNKYTEIVKLSNIEQKKILDFLDINKSSLLYLCYDDMISIWYDLYPNDIIKIKTTSPLSNILTSYYKLVSKESLSGFRFLFINKDNIIILNDKSSDSSFESELDDKSDDLNNDDDSDVYSNKNNIDSDNEIGTDKGELCPHSDFVES